MPQNWQNRLWEYIRANPWRLLKYCVSAAGLWLLGFGVIIFYADYLGVDDELAYAMATGTMAAVVYIVNRLLPWADREVDMRASMRRWIIFKFVMGTTPQVAYLVLVSMYGLSAGEAKIGISLFWGLPIALPLTYFVLDKWVLAQKETEKA